MSEILVLVEKVFTVFTLVVMSGGVFPIVLSGGFSEGDLIAGPKDFPQLQILFLLIYLVTLFLLTLRWRKAMYVVSQASFILIWLLVGMSVVSTFWSFTPEMTRIRSLALAGTSLFGLYLASR
jgi:exopolysaccharide production protein ExoQ